MMQEKFGTRTEALIGHDGTRALESAAVLVCGLGGVGGYALEALARAGVGRLGLLDGDVVEESNLNRQILATTRTVGMKKTQAGKERVLSVNPGCVVETYDLFYLPATADEVELSRDDWVIAPVDTVAAPVQLISPAQAPTVTTVGPTGTGTK